jgi:hypothetical protein
MGVPMENIEDKMKSDNLIEVHLEMSALCQEIA